jgi:hypothetical protein
MTDLAEIIAKHYPIHAGQDCDGDGWVDCRCMKLADAPVEEWIAHVAEAITESRTIRTVEELNALPPQSVVMEIDPAQDSTDPLACVHRKVHVCTDDQYPYAFEDLWEQPGDSGEWPVTEVELPVWLLWTPEARA